MVFNPKSLIFGTMTQAQRVLVCLVVGALGIPSPGNSKTADGSNPYQKIPEQNVFRLKPPPPPPSEEPPKIPTPKITLTGISTFGKKRAWLKTPPPPVKPGEQPKGEQFYSLGVGERDGEMEMLEIDEQAGAVKVKYAGTEVALNFVDNGAKPSVAPALPMPGQAIPQPGGVMPLPVPTVQPNPNLPGARPLPTRTLRLPTPAGGPTGYNPGTGYTPVSTGTYIPPATAPTVALPSFNMSTPAATAPAPPAQQHEQLTAEQQMVLMEIQREQNRNNPVFPPMPATPLSPQQQPPVPQNARPQ